jgi:hypothetical protein
MDRPVALAAAETDGDTSPNVAGSSRGYFELLPDEGTDGCGGSRQRQHQSSAPSRPWLSRPELSAAEGAALGRHKDRIRRFSESRVECALLQIVVQNHLFFTPMNDLDFQYYGFPVPKAWIEWTILCWTNAPVGQGKGTWQCTPSRLSPFEGGVIGNYACTSTP